jgi:hypothetical protein
MLHILKRKKDQKSPRTYGLLVGMIELRPRPGIRRADVKSKTVDAGHLGAADVVSPILRRLVASEANLK